MLTEEQVSSPFADLRKASISFWLASGVDPVEVARRAGHSAAVLYNAKMLDSRRDQANALIERAMRAAAQETKRPDLRPRPVHTSRSAAGHQRSGVRHPERRRGARIARAPSDQLSS